MDELKKEIVNEPLKEKPNKEEKEPWKKETKDENLSTKELIEKKFNEFKISNIIGECPHEILNVIYQSGPKVNLGNIITPYQARQTPCMFYWPVETNKLYTIMFIDFDSISVNDESHFYLIFLACNIYGNDIMKSKQMK